MKSIIKLFVLAALLFSFAYKCESAPKRSSVSKSKRASVRQTTSYVNPYRQSPYVGVLAFELDSGRVLFADKADAKAYPASITKLMTVYLVLDDIKAGKISISDKVVASPTITALDKHLRQPSSIGLRGGQALTVNELLVWLMVRSANDSAIFLAEKCSGSMDAFVKRMNNKARELGMKNTIYYNPNGLPPLNKSGSVGFNVSTCNDLSILVRSLLKRHPEILKYTCLKTRNMRLPNGESVTIINTNNIMVKNDLKIINPDGSEAVDGLKTGYIDAGGSSIVLTGKRNGKRVVVIVLGSSSRAERDAVARFRMEDALDALCF